MLSTPITQANADAILLETQHDVAVEEIAGIMPSLKR